VVFASHHWPTWGRERAVEFLALQRDLCAYLHDQTLRMMNAGMVGSEIAEAMVLPPALEDSWHARGYYGSVSHDVKAIYQRYMGWYDGNPAKLWQHPPVGRAVRYLEFMGGADAFEQLGYGSENGTWRCAYLSGPTSCATAASAPRGPRCPRTSWPSSPRSSSSTPRPSASTAPAAGTSTSPWTWT
jgi:alkyl sulfatase BDS1-like metallo-beta-lactamase superfamily hydrolase